MVLEEAAVRHMIDCPLMSHAAHMGLCDLCSKELPPRRSRWCSNKCSRWFIENHRWTNARRKARARARAGKGQYWCADCGNKTAKPEVNHIKPCIGKHGEMGCHHHQDNLEVLCHTCHVAKTAAQRAAGLFKRSAGGSSAGSIAA